MTLTRNFFEAEDLVQETYVRAIEATGRLREHSNVKAWLYTILRNIRLNQVRQRATSPKLVELDAYDNAADLAIDSGRDPHALYVNKVEKQQVQAALHQLSEEHREIIVLREYADLSYQQIATLLNCPLGTVMSRLARARSKLGTLLSATQTPTARQAELPEEIVDQTTSLQLSSSRTTEMGITSKSASRPAPQNPICRIDSEVRDREDSRR